MKIHLYFFILLSLFTVNLNATTIVYKTLNQLIDESDYAVGGTISNTSSSQHNGGNIYTTLSLQDAYFVTESGSIPTNKTIKIRYLGGEVEIGEGKNKRIIGQTVAGMPGFKKNEKIFVFLKNNGTEDVPFYGFSQGIFFIDNNDGLLNAYGKKIIDVQTLSSIFTTLLAPAEEVIVNYSDANPIERLGTFKEVIQSSREEFLSYIQEQYQLQNKKIANKSFSNLFTLPNISEKIIYAVAPKDNK